MKTMKTHLLLLTLFAFSTFGNCASPGVAAPPAPADGVLKNMNIPNGEVIKGVEKAAIEPEPEKANSVQPHNLKCEEWCQDSCSNLNGNIKQECGGCNETMQCNPRSKEYENFDFTKLKKSPTSDDL